LYQMLTGAVPFDGESVGEVLMKHLTARADVSRLPEPFRAVVGKALEKDPARRQQHVYELLPPEDAPRAPSVRFIGDGKTAPPLPPPSPPVLPGARVRVAELAGSMLWAAPAAALLALVSAGLLEGDVASHPERLAYLFGLTLLSAWASMLPAKLLEGRGVD